MYFINYYFYCNRIKFIKKYIKCLDICLVFIKIEIIIIIVKVDKYFVIILVIVLDDNWFELLLLFSLLLFFWLIGFDGFGFGRLVGYIFCIIVNERYYRKLLRCFFGIICWLKRLKNFVLIIFKWYMSNVSFFVILICDWV